MVKQGCEIYQGHVNLSREKYVKCHPPLQAFQELDKDQVFPDGKRQTVVKMEGFFILFNLPSHLASFKTWIWWYCSRECYSLLILYNLIEWINTMVWNFKRARFEHKGWCQVCKKKGVYKSFRHILIFKIDRWFKIGYLHFWRYPALFLVRLSQL